MSSPAQHDVDVRFLLANERTLLAWVRTALTLLAGGVGILQLVDESWRLVPGFALLGLGALAAAMGTRRFQRTDGALRRGEVPAKTRAPVLVASAVAVVGVALIVAGVFGGLG